MSEHDLNWVVKLLGITSKAEPKPLAGGSVRVDAKEILKVTDEGFQGNRGCESNLFASCHFRGCDFGLAERTMRLAHQRLPALVQECFKQAQVEALRRLTDEVPQAEATNK